jgi:riboflavin synthase
MFTGIIKARGTISAIKRGGGDVRLTVQSRGLPWSDYELGESIAVNGVCLTAVALHEDGFDTDVSVETLDVTGLGQLAVGSAVNLEPAISLGERLGGHLVSGHVDCTGTIKSRAADARSIRLVIEVPAEYSRYLAKKGSVCVDGVSLTINDVSVNRFEVNIIPHTAEVTIIEDYQAGTVVNIEVDLLARYIERLLSRDETGISEDFLKANGYA